MFLNFQTPTNFTVNTLNSKSEFYHGVMPPNDANGIANSEDPDQTASLSGSAVSAKTCQSENLGSLR